MSAKISNPVVAKFGPVFEQTPHVKALGIKLVASGDGDAEMALPYSPSIVGFPETGVIAGGAVLTLMDSVGGVAVWAKMTKLYPIATLDLRIDYLRPATKGQTLYGHATCYRLTRNVAFVRGLACHEAHDRPIAEMAAKFFIDTESEPYIDAS